MQPLPTQAIYNKCVLLCVHYLDEVNREPFTEPKQDRPTNTGIIQAIGPRW